MLDLIGMTNGFGGRTTRRGCLRIGALSLGGLSLAQWLRLKEAGAVDEAGRRKSVIMVYLSGGRAISTCMT